LRNSSIEGLEDHKQLTRPAITLAMIILLTLVCFLWNSELTNTSSSATSLIQQSIGGLTSGLKEDAKSNDVRYSIFSSSSESPQHELQQYTKNIVYKTRASAPAGTYYPNSEIAKYPLTALKPANSPMTRLGQWLTQAGVNVYSLNTVLKQTWAELLQIFVAIGLIYAVFRKKFNDKLEIEYLSLAIGSVLFVIAQVVLPYLSIAYGLLRAFQQSLMILGLFIVVGTFAMTSKFRPKYLRAGLPAALAVSFFLASTSVISQVLGGYQPQLHLNNNGQYYDIYYLHKQEAVAIDWLSSQVSKNNQQSDVQSEVQTDRYALAKISYLSNIQPQNDITPGLIRKNAYVYLGYTDTVKHQTTITYNSDLVTYAYPIQFLSNNKNLIYNNGGSEIYR
jgi:uncharacterized membrane protein